MEGYLGEIRMFAGTFAPQYWAFCDGQILSISDNTPLFSILGTTYGGNGHHTFALPDLRNRFPIHTGEYTGNNTFTLGQTGGTETVTLTADQLPAHNHPLNVSSEVANTTNGLGSAIANSVDKSTGAQLPGYINPAPKLVSAEATSVGSNIGGQPHDNMPPFNTLNFIICITGNFPNRN